MTTFEFVADDTTIDVSDIIVGVLSTITVNSVVLTGTVFAVDISDQTAATNAAIEAALVSNGGRSFQWNVVEILADAKARRIDELASDVATYLEGHYSSGTKETLILMMVECVDDDLPNRMAHIRTGTNWIGSVIDEFFECVDAVIACTTIEDVDDCDINFTPFDATDPSVTVASALEVTT